MWPRRNGAEHAAGSDASFIAKLDRKDEEREVKVAKQIARKSAPQVSRETGRIERSLEAVQKELRRDHPDLRAVAQALSDIAHRSDEVIRTVDKIRIIDRRLRNFDWHELQQLSGYFAQLDDGDKERLKEQIQLERNKIVQEHGINVLAERCERHHGEFRRLLDEAQKDCYAQNSSAALSHVSTALTMEAQQNADLKALQQLERRLFDLTRLKLKKE